MRRVVLSIIIAFIASYSPSLAWSFAPSLVPEEIYPLESQESVALAPLIVMPHGGPHARDYYGYDPLVQSFAARGFHVFQPNFRGSTNAGIGFEALGHGEWGGAMQDDLTDGIAWLFYHELSTPEQTCIVGVSYGGYAALVAATRKPEQIKCAVAVNAVSDLSAMIKSDKSRFGKRSLNYEIMISTLGNPKQDAERLIQRSPIAHVATLGVPVLLIHGTEDRRVDFSQSTAFHEAAEAAGKEVTFEIYHGLGHGGWGRIADIRLAYDVIAFVERAIALQ